MRSNQTHTATAVHLETERVDGRVVRWYRMTGYHAGTDTDFDDRNTIYNPVFGATHGAAGEIKFLAGDGYPLTPGDWLESAVRDTIDRSRR